MNQDNRGTLEDTLFEGIIDNLTYGQGSPLTLYLASQHADTEKVFKVQADWTFLSTLTRLQAVCTREPVLAVVAECPGHAPAETLLIVSKNHFWLTHVQDDSPSHRMSLSALIEAVCTGKAPEGAILKDNVLVFAQNGAAQATAEELYYAKELTKEFFDYEMPEI